MFTLHILKLFIPEIQLHEKMDISVVVAVRNEINYIEKCIESLFKQDFDGEYEVIVVDGMSDDGTYEMLEKLQKKYKFILLKNPKKNAAAGRNMGIKEADGDIIAFIDGDAMAYPDWLSNIYEELEKNEEVAGVGGPDLLPDNAPFISRAIGYVMTSPLARGGKLNPSTQHTMMEKKLYVEHIPTCNLALRRKIFDEVGMFDESFVKGQDLELSYRIKKAGYKLLYVPSIKVIHHRKENIKQFSKQIYKWAKAKVAIIKKHGLHSITEHIYLWPLYGIIAALTALLLFWMLNIFWLFFSFAFIVGILYTLIILFESARIAITQHDGKLFLYALILLPTIHISYSYGVMAALMRRKIWE